VPVGSLSLGARSANGNMEGGESDLLAALTLVRSMEERSFEDPMAHSVMSGSMNAQLRSVLQQSSGPPTAPAVPPASVQARDALPSVVVTKDDILDTTNARCSVCFEKYRPGMRATRMFCGHLFCTSCIWEWLGTANSCPVCRYELPTDCAKFEGARRDRMSGRKACLKEGELRAMSVPRVRQVMRTLGVASHGSSDKADLIAHIRSDPGIELVHDREDVRYEEAELKSLDLGGLRSLMRRHRLTPPSVEMGEREAHSEALRRFQAAGWLDTPEVPLSCGECVPQQRRRERSRGAPWKHRATNDSTNGVRAELAPKEVGGDCFDPARKCHVLDASSVVRVPMLQNAGLASSAELSGNCRNGTVLGDSRKSILCSPPEYFSAKQNQSGTLLVPVSSSRASEEIGDAPTTQHATDVVALAALQPCKKVAAYRDEVIQQSIVLEGADPLWMQGGAVDGTAPAQAPLSCGAVIDCSLLEALETSYTLDPEPNNSQPESCARAKNVQNHACDESFLLQTLDTPRLLSLMKNEEIEPDIIRKKMRQGKNHKQQGLDVNTRTDDTSSQQNAIAHSSMADLCTNLSMHGVSSSSSSSSSSPVPPLALVNASESAYVAVASTGASPRHFGHNSSEDTIYQSKEFRATSPAHHSRGAFACQLEGPSASLRMAADCVAGPVSPGVACSPAAANLNTEVGPVTGAVKDESKSLQGVTSKTSFARCYCRFLHCWSRSSKASA